jgi:hypothetical protein
MSVMDLIALPQNIDQRTVLLSMIINFRIAKEKKKRNSGFFAHRIASQEALSSKESNTVVIKEQELRPQDHRGGQLLLYSLFLIIIIW